MWIVLLWLYNFSFCKWWALALSLFLFSTQLCFENGTTFDTKWQLTVYLSLLPEETVLFFDFFLQTQRNIQTRFWMSDVCRACDRLNRMLLVEKPVTWVPAVAAIWQCRKCCRMVTLIKRPESRFPCEISWFFKCWKMKTKQNTGFSRLPQPDFYIKTFESEKEWDQICFRN